MREWVFLIAGHGEFACDEKSRLHLQVRHVSQSSDQTT